MRGADGAHKSMTAIGRAGITEQNRTEQSFLFGSNQASKFVKIHGSKLLLLSLRAGSKTIFVVANLLGFEQPPPIHGSYSGSACPQLCYNVINIMIYGRHGCICLFE